MEGLKMKDLIVVEIELDGVRLLYGPFTTALSAERYAKVHVEDADRVMIRPLYALTDTQHIHPNQTTIEDHITDIHDAVL